MEKLFSIVGAAIGSVAVIIALGIILAIPVWLLWNWLMPTLFGLTELTLFQAWGVNVLCGCLFKSSS